MKCSECGKEEGSVKMYSTLFKFSCDEDDVFSASFDKTMCKECLVMNIRSLSTDIEFLYEDCEIDNSAIFTNADFIELLG
jgi:hypothetical protein